MSRLKSNSNPRTPYTDGNGRLLEEYALSAFCVNSIAEAKNAGIPEELLHSSGWNGDENDLRGYFTSLIYTMSDFLASLERDMSRIEHLVISPMLNVCLNCGVDYRTAMAGIFDAARLLRDIGEGPLSQRYKPVVDDLDLLGAPCGPEHDGHGHGLAAGVWCCFTE